MVNWIKSSDYVNWPNVKTDKLWTTDKTTTPTNWTKGDRIIFWMRETGYFGGIFEVVSDWYPDNYTWGNGDVSKNRIDLKTIQLGYAEWDKLKSKLEFSKKKKGPGQSLLLRNSASNFANHNKPISDNDEKLILDELKNNQTPPQKFKNAVKEIEKSLQKEKKKTTKKPGKNSEPNPIIENLKLNKQIVLYGPPGTSKTFNAKKVAVEMLLGKNIDAKDIPEKFTELQNQNKVDLVQFHPSYSYEDFVQGIKPTTNDGTISYQVRDGIFKKICDFEDIEHDLPSNDFKILIIDEINRGNLSKIFGELIYALEYRGESIRLQYADFDDDDTNDFLTVPENLYLIGTMNTADRSVSLFDTAMRRRFAFVPMMVNYDLVAEKIGINVKEYTKSEFERIMKNYKNKPEENSILSLFAVYKINQMISRDLRMGREKQVGHTYLLKIVNQKEQFLNVWKYQIIPLLEEFYSAKMNDLKGLLNPSIFDDEKGLLDFKKDDLETFLRQMLSK